MGVPKKYFWLKLKDTFFSNPKIKKLRKIAGGDTFSVIYLKLMLLSLKNDGVIEIEGLEPTIEEELALVIDEEVDNVRLTIAYLRKTQLLEDQLLGHILMVEVPSLIGKESDSAARMRRLREKQASQSDDDVRIGYKNVTTEIEKEIDIEKDSLFLSQKVSFREFKKILQASKVSFTLDNGLCGFSPNTQFILSPSGFIHNLTASKDVGGEDAKKIWAHLYENRQKIIEHLKHQNKEEIQQ